MMKTLFFLLLFMPFAFVSLAQEVIISDTLTYDSIRYHYELNEDILKPERKTLSIRTMLDYDQENDVAGKVEAFHSLIKYKDSHKEKKTIHVKIYFSAKEMGKWRPDVRNSMETIFHFGTKKITYKSHGDKMHIHHKRLHHKSDDFDSEETQQNDILKKAVEEFIQNYNALFLKKKKIDLPVEEEIIGN